MFPSQSPGQIMCNVAGRSVRLHCSYEACNSLANKLLALLNQHSSTKCIRQIHCQMLKNSMHRPNIFLSRLIAIKDLDYSLLHFTKIPNPNEYSFNIMIRGLTTTWGKFNLAIELYYRMKLSGLVPDNYTYPFLFIACSKIPEAGYGRAVHSSVIKVGLYDDAHIHNSLITMYSLCRDMDCARKVFDGMTGRDLVSWNSMISGYSKMGYSREALDLFRNMQTSEHRPDESTLVSMLGACGDVGDLLLGRSIQNFVLRNNIAVNSYTGSSLIDMYSKCGDVGGARRVFEGMNGYDRIAWNAMITGLTQNGLSEDAIAMYGLMKKEGVSPDQRTVAVILSACASLGMLELGKSMDAYASDRGFAGDAYVATSLIDMYAKCGCLHEARRVFDSLGNKNRASWNSMINGLALNGHGREAVSLFWRMVRTDFRPSSVTFIGLLSGCVHSGMIDEGLELFGKMVSAFGVVPGIEHYSCVVDLLGRAGRVGEAWELVREMPGRPDEAMLCAILGSCQRQRNLEVSVEVTRLLLATERSANSGNYVLSSKVLAKLNMMDDSAAAWAMMRRRGVGKTPGCSWIEVDGRIHQFRAGDRFEASVHGILRLLDLLLMEMRLEGHVPHAPA